MPNTQVVGRPTDEAVTQRILSAALEIAATDGYDTLRIEHVARRAACGKPAIYRRYPDKAHLVAEAILSVAVVGETPDTGDVTQDLLAHVLVNRENQSHPHLREAAGRGLAAIFEPRVYTLLSERLFSKRRQQGTTILERGIARGDLPVDVDTDLILDALAGLTMFRQSVTHAGVSAAQYRQVIAALVDNPPRRAAAATN